MISLTEPSLSVLRSDTVSEVLEVVIGHLKLLSKDFPDWERTKDIFVYFYIYFITLLLQLQLLPQSFCALKGPAFSLNPTHDPF